MIIVRIAETFRERAPEWIMAIIQTGWGLNLLVPGGVFDRPFFKTLATLAPRATWGTVMFTVGLSRMVALYMNGAHRQTPLIRQIGCMTGMFFWGLLMLNAVNVTWRSPSVCTYAGLFVLELIMFSYAAGDAARAACRRRNVRHGGRVRASELGDSRRVDDLHDRSSDRGVVGSTPAGAQD